MNFSVKFTTIDEIAVENKKTYINTFTINLGIKQVKIERFTPEPENEEE